MSTDNQTGSAPKRWVRAMSQAFVIEHKGSGRDDNGNTYQIFEVISGNSGNKYVCAPEVGMCTCPDAQYTTHGHTFCKHQIAAAAEHDLDVPNHVWGEKRAELQDLIDEVVGTQKKRLKRHWREYRETVERPTDQMLEAFQSEVDRISGLRDKFETYADALAGVEEKVREKT